MKKYSTFAGWQSEVDYLASEAERQKRVDRAIELHKRMQQEDEIRPLSLRLRLAIIFGSALLGGLVLWAVFDAALKAMGL